MKSIPEKENRRQYKLAEIRLTRRKLANNSLTKYNRQMAIHGRSTSVKRYPIKHRFSARINQTRIAAAMSKQLVKFGEKGIGVPRKAEIIKESIIAGLEVMMDQIIRIENETTMF